MCSTDASFSSSSSPSSCASFSLDKFCAYLLSESQSKQLQNELTRVGAGWIEERYQQALQTFVSLVSTSSAAPSPSPSPSSSSASFSPSASSSSKEQSLSSSLSFLRQFAWDELHTGPWQEVDIIWRKLYERCGLIECCFFLLLSSSFNCPDHAVAVNSTKHDASKMQSRIEEVLKQLDLCLMMGSSENCITPFMHQLIAHFERRLEKVKKKEEGTKIAEEESQPSVESTTAEEEKRRVAKKRKIDSNDTNYASSSPSLKTEQQPVPLSSSSSSRSANHPSPVSIPSPIPSLPTSPLATLIPRISAPSLFHFLHNYMLPQHPCILLHCMDHWPAFQENSERKWSLEYLKRKAGERTVPVEIGRDYLREDWKQQLMTINQFIDTHMMVKQDDDATTTTEAGNDSNKDSAAKQKSTPIGYLAQHALLSQIPALRNDISLPDYCSLSTKGIEVNNQTDATDECRHNNDDEEEEVQINAWIGPSGTISPLHFDPDHNLFAQIKGKKYWRIIRPEYSSSLYPNGSTTTVAASERNENGNNDESKEGNANPVSASSSSSSSSSASVSGSMLSNTSLVDIEHIDPYRFPLALQVPYYECVLNEGEMLYVPPKFWHYVRAVEMSFSVSFWWK